MTISTAGFSDWVDIGKFTLADDGAGGQSLNAFASIVTAQLARITVDKVTTDAGITQPNEQGFSGRQFWKVVLVQTQPTLYTEGDYYLYLNANTPNLNRCVILPNNLYRIHRHRHQRDMAGSVVYESLSVELDESATAKYRELNAVSPATLPFGQ